MKRSHYSHELTPGLDGKHVRAAGWVENVRKVGKIAFLKVRDREGTFQVTLPQDKVGALFGKVDEVSLESVVGVEGIVRASKQAPNGVEIIPSKLEILSKARSPLPMDVSGKIESELETRLDSRFMDLRMPRTAAVFGFRSVLQNGIREFFENEGFVEVHTPKIVMAGAEGGATLFPIDYFGQKAYLAQSPQLYKQSLMSTGLDRVYEIGPVFRAEPSATTRHLSEFTGLDFEMAFIDSMEDVLDIIERMIAFSVGHAAKHGKEYLEVLGVTLRAPKTPFKRITFDRAKAMLEEKGKKVGDDLDSEAERALGELVKDDFYFITEYPASIKPFYIMEKPGSDASWSFDLDCRGTEIASGGQREHRFETLVARMKKHRLNPDAFSFYLSAFKYGMPPHGGMGLGLDRLVQKLLGLGNVREAVLFPRDRVRLVP
jgi:aspartyl-tRNA synthetase